MTQFRVIAAGLLAVFIWGAIPVAVKLTLSTLSVSQYLFLRFAMGLVIMTPWLRLVMRKRVSFNLWWWIALTLDLGANYFFQTLAMQGMPASWYIVIFALNPILALVVLRVRLTKRVWLSVAVATLGTLLFTQTGDFSTPIRTLDVVCIVIGMLTWVFYTLIVSKLQKHYSDVEITAVTQFLSFVAVVVIWGASGFPFVGLQGEGLGGVLFLGLCTPAAYFLFSYALRYMPAFGVASQYMEPVFGVALAYLVFGETLTLAQSAGAVGIIAATAFMSKEP